MIIEITSETGHENNEIIEITNETGHIHNFYITKKNEITCEIGHDYLFSVIYGFLQNSMQNGEITNEKGHGNKPNHQ